jgi:Ser/Thr protein kinase RdoA (MazF antagonist)
MTVSSKVLECWDLQNAQAEPLGAGLINETYLVTDQQGERFVLQRLNPVFAPQVNLDIDKLTRHLELSGVATQRLVATRDGTMWAEVDARAWRMSTYVPGVCFDLLETEAQAVAAGALLGRFHASVRDLEISLHTERLGVHDTQRHVQSLATALREHREHRFIAEIEALSQAIFAEADKLPELPGVPDRLVHGDPKISNLVFDETTGQGICMIDLDTLTHMPLPLEMGDAFRSWCNPRGEDTERSQFHLDLFAAAIRGYAEATSDFVQEVEWRAFVTATRTITVELAARFATDALNESYFRWKPESFPDRSTHNQVRAAGQLELHRSLCEQFDAAEKIVADAFS